MGITWDDACAFQKAQETNPLVELCSPGYETIIRNEFFKACRAERHYVLVQLWAKLGVLFFYFLKYAGLGLILTFFYRKPWWLELAYWVGFALSSLPGLLTVPTGAYIVGFFAITIFYTIQSFLFGLQEDGLQRLKDALKQMIAMIYAWLKGIKIAW